MCLTVLMLIMLRNNEVDRRMGISLLLILVGYTAFLWIKKDVPEGEVEEAKEDLKETKEEGAQWKHFLIVFGIACIFSFFTAQGENGVFTFTWGISTISMILL